MPTLYYYSAHSFTIATFPRADNRLWNLLRCVFICIYSGNLTQGQEKKEKTTTNAKQTEANKSILVR